MKPKLCPNSAGNVMPLWKYRGNAFPKMAKETDDVAPEAEGALTSFEILHATARIPMPYGPLPTGKPGVGNNIFRTSRAPGRFGTGLPDSIGAELSTEHWAEGCSLCRGAENCTPDSVIEVIGWFVKGTVNLSVKDTPDFWMI